MSVLRDCAGVVLGLVSATLAGLSLVRLLPGRRSPYESVAWSFAAGLLVQALLELVFLALGIAPGPIPFLVGDALLAAASLAVRRPRVWQRGLPQRRLADPAALALAGVAALAALVFFVEAMGTSPDATDFLAVWGLKAKTIAASASLPGRLFHDPALAWSHPEYPLLVPLSLAGLAGFAQKWDARALALFYPACQVATLAALAGFWIRRGFPRKGAGAAALAALCFSLYGRGNVGTAEIPLALGFVLLGEAFLDARSREPGSLARVAIASLFCAATKKEGTLFPLLLAGCALFARGRFGGNAGKTAAALAAPPLLHGLLLLAARGPVGWRDFDMGLLAPSRWGELPPRLAEAASRIFWADLLPALPALLALLLFFALTPRGESDLLLAPCALQIFAYAVTCAFSSFGVAWLVDASFARTSLALFPLLALILAARAGRTAPREIAA